MLRRLAGALAEQHQHEPADEEAKPRRAVDIERVTPPRPGSLLPQHFAPGPRHQVVARAWSKASPGRPV